MTVESLRRTLYSWMKLLSYMMDHNLSERSLRKMKAIEDIRLRLDVIAHCSLHVHYRWILKLRNDIIDILPYADGRYKNTRKRILDLLHEAERTINADHRQRVLVS